MKRLLLSFLTLLTVLTASAQGSELSVDSLTFTYWTADAQVLPLPVASQQLTVPAQAVAVDLRGIGRITTVFTVDATLANPNCLYYLDADDPLPEGLDAETCNVVCNQQAANVRLSEDHDFFCPLPFRAQFVSFLMKPTNEGIFGGGYSETLVLPFRPTHVLLYDVNGQPGSMHADLLKIFRYEGNVGDSLILSPIGDLRQMVPYQPHILGVYVGSRLLFEAEDAEVPMTRESISSGDGYHLKGTTVARMLSGSVYQYVPQVNGFVLHAGGWQLPPFRACIVPGGEKDEGWGPSGVGHVLSFGSGVWGAEGSPTAIGSPRLPSAPSSSQVFSLSGQRLTAMPRTPGLYIVRGKKLLVR